MSRKIIGVTVGTPISPARLDREIKPVKTVNGVSPDENGNVDISGEGGSGDSGVGVIDLNMKLDSIGYMAEFTPYVVRDDAHLVSTLAYAFGSYGVSSSEMHFFDAEMPIMRIVSAPDDGGLQLTRELMCVGRMLDWQYSNYGYMYMDFKFGDLTVRFDQVGYMEGDDFVPSDPVVISVISPDIGDIDKALDELHNYAQALIGGGE